MGMKKTHKLVKKIPKLFKKTHQSIKQTQVMVQRVTRQQIFQKSYCNVMNIKQGYVLIGHHILSYVKVCIMISLIITEVISQIRQIILYKIV